MHAPGFDHRGTRTDGGIGPYFGYQSARIAKSDEAAMQLFGLPMSSAPDTRRGVAQPRLHDAYYSGGTLLLANRSAMEKSGSKRRLKLATVTKSLMARRSPRTLRSMLAYALVPMSTIGCESQPERSAASFAHRGFLRTT